MRLAVELAGLEIFGYHGVNEEERTHGQPFLFDVELEVPPDALADRIEAAVDYRDVTAVVRQVSGARQFQLLEALAAAVAEALLSRFAVERVRVRVRKPEVDLSGPVEHAAAIVELSR